MFVHRILLELDGLTSGVDSSSLREENDMSEPSKEHQKYEIYVIINHGLMVNDEIRTQQL
jgi:hypothetical protein